MNKHLRRLSMLFFIPFTVLCLAAFAVSICTTIYYDTNQGADLPRFGAQNFAVLIPGTALFVLVAILVLKRNKRIILPALMFAGILCLVIILSVRGTAVTDGLTLDEIINAFDKGDYSSLAKGGYLFVYPFQIGYVAIGQLLSALFGPSNYLVYQLINLISVLLTIVYLYFTTWELFEDKRVCDIFALLSFLLFFFYVYSVYVYNDIWSVAPGIMALYYEILYLKKQKVKHEIVAGICLGVACLLKTNLYIALIAMAILLAVDLLNRFIGFSEKDFDKNRFGIKKAEMKRPGVGEIILTFALITFLAICALLPLKVIGNKYATIAGLENFPAGVPKTTYFAMAMQEGEGEWGWYNGFNRNTYAETDYDYEKTDEIARNAIEDRLSEFAERPLHAVRFYARKFATQWADPTFVSIRNLELAERHSESNNTFAHSLVYGRWGEVFAWVMDVEHFLVFLGIIAYCLITIKRKSFNFPQALPVLFVFGGMLFHQIWEGSSRYIIRYFLTLMPLSAYGIRELITLLPVSIPKNWKK